MKKLLWAIIILLLVAYCLLVYSWILQGNRNFEENKREATYQNSISRH